MRLRTTLPLALVCTVCAWSDTASATDQAPARVIVHVEQLPPPGAVPNARDMRLHVTGMGFPPRRAVGTAQGRLMARRGAMVDGYRKIANATNRWRVEAGERAHYSPPHVTAFVQGARVERERYFNDGRVEVDMSAPPPTGVPNPRSPDEWRRFQETAARAGMPIVTTTTSRAAPHEISREDWEGLFAVRQAGTSQSAHTPREESSEEGEP